MHKTLTIYTNTDVGDCTSCFSLFELSRGELGISTSPVGKSSSKVGLLTIGLGMPKLDCDFDFEYTNKNPDMTASSTPNHAIGENCVRKMYAPSRTTTILFVTAKYRNPSLLAASTPTTRILRNQHSASMPSPAGYTSTAVMLAPGA